MPLEAGNKIWRENASALRVALCILVIFLSGWMQWTTVNRTIVDTPVRADAALYVAYAWNLEHHGVFSRAETWLDPAAHTEPPPPDKMTLPGYPAFLTLFLSDKVDWPFIKRVTITQAVLGVATCALMLLIAIRLLPFGWAIAFGSIVAIHPHLSTISTYLNTEALYTFLVAASLFAIVKACPDDARKRWYLLAAILIALACYVRPQLKPLPWILAAACLLPALRPRLPKVAAGLLVFAVMLLPWQLRNAQTERTPGEPDLLAYTLYHGSFPGLMYQDDPRTFGIAYRSDPKAQEHGRDVGAALAHIGAEFRAHPLRMAAWYAFGKPWMFLSWSIAAGGGGDIYIYPVVTSPFQDSPPHLLARALARGLHTLLVIAALAAILAAWLRPAWFGHDQDAQRAFRVLALVGGLLLLMHAIGAPYARYGVPFRPLFYLLAFGLITALSSRLRTAGSGSRRPTKPLTRWRAASIHLMASLVLVATVCLLMLWIWFPDGLISVAGMSRYVLLLLCIDLCIGPLITLIVYKAGKPRLRFDLTVIALLQLAFFAYGLHAIWQTRPVYLVGAVDRLTLVFANQVDGITRDFELPTGRPVLVGARIPENREERDAILNAALAGGADIDMRPQYYVPYEQVAPGLREHARTLDSLELSAGESSRLSEAARRAHLDPARALILPVMSSRKTGTAILAPDDLKPRAIVEIDGYELFGRNKNK